MMAELVKVSDVGTTEELQKHIAEYFAKGQYDEITKAIGMHSILVSPEHMLTDQRRLYQQILQLVKNRISGADSKLYSSWLVAFPKLMGKLISHKEIVTDEAALTVLASRHAAFGAFESVDEFFFWALDDRRLPLEQIIRYIEKTVEMQGKQ
jgi:hypothetical protein